MTEQFSFTTFLIGKIDISAKIVHFYYDNNKLAEKYIFLMAISWKKILMVMDIYGGAHFRMMTL